MSNRVQALPSTFSIEDPAVRSFCDALANAWELRNGNIGADDSKRFITKEEFDGMARNAMYTALSGAADSVVTKGPTTGDGAVAGPILDLIEQMIRGSALYDLLNRRVELIEPPQEVADALLEEMRKQLGEQNAAIVAINTISSDSSSVSARTLQGQIVKMEAAESAIIQERTTRIENDQAIATDVYVLTARVNENQGNIVEEKEARVDSDTAFVSAVNTLWGIVGNSNALVQGGDTVVVNPGAGTAVNWTQVQAAVTDPNTGRVNSSAILQETRAYANAVDNTFNASWTVRTTVAYGNRTVVGGFGLMATNGAGSTPGQEITFGVIANQFWVGAPLSNWSNDDAARDMYNGGAGQIPFTVITTPTTYNNVTIPAGVYMKKATIGDALIDTAKIAQHINSTNFNGSFDGYGNINYFGTSGWAIDKSGLAVFNNVKVRGDVEATSIRANSVDIIETLMLRGNSVTIPVAAKNDLFGPLSWHPPGSSNALVSVDIDQYSANRPIIIIAAFDIIKTVNTSIGACTYYITANKDGGGTNLHSQEVSAITWSDDYGTTFTNYNPATLMALHTPAIPGTYYYYCSANTGRYGFVLWPCRIIALVCKR